jgi:hypothetical protein
VEGPAVASTPTDLPVVGMLVGAVLERVITSSGSSSAAGSAGGGLLGRECACFVVAGDTSNRISKEGRPASKHGAAAAAGRSSGRLWPTQQLLLGVSGVQRLHGLAAELAAACLQADVAIALGALACKMGAAARGLGWNRWQIQGVRPQGSGLGTAWLLWHAVWLRNCRWWAMDASVTALCQPAGQQGRACGSRVAFFFPYTDLTRVLMGRTTRKYRMVHTRTKVRSTLRKCLQGRAKGMTHQHLL